MSFKTRALSVNSNEIMEEKLIKSIKKYSTFTWYYTLDRILKCEKDNTEKFIKMRNDIFSEISSDFNIQNYVIALLLAKIFVHSEDRGNNQLLIIDAHDLKKSLKILYKLVISASDFICSNDILSDVLTVWRYARGWQSVHYIQCKSFAQLHRILYLFGEIPFSSEMAKYNKEHSINFKEMFYAIFNIEMEEYLKFCFLLFFNFGMNGSVLEFNLFVESCKTLISENFNAKNLFNFFCADDVTIHSDENSNFPREKKYQYNAVPLLKSNPILKFNHDGKAEIYMPFPYLVFEKSMDLIYFNSQATNRNFQSWFGRLFEQYCGRVLKETFLDADVCTDTFSRKNSGKLDFFILKNDTAILVECKAARIYRAFTESEDINEMNKTFEHIKKAHGQLISFVDNLKDVKDGFEKIKNIYGLIIMWDEFSSKISDVHMKTFIQHDNSNFNDVIPFKILSINMLEHLQASLSITTNQVDKFIDIYNDNNAFEKLTMESKIGNSFLNKYYTKLTEKWISRT